MRPGRMSAQVNSQLHVVADAVLRRDPDLTGGFRIIDAEFSEGVWFAKVATVGRKMFAITFNSVEGIRVKTPIPS